MISPHSSFEFVDRGFRDTMVLVPGWAADHRIFYKLELPYNYILCMSANDTDFAEELARSLDDERLESAAVFGWSMGGYLARDFAVRYPSRVSALYLVGMRERYDPAVLAEIKSKLVKNRRAYLYSFYKDCFSANDAEGYSYFRRELMRLYLDTMPLDGLIAGLDYLERAEMSKLSVIPAKAGIQSSCGDWMPAFAGMTVHSSFPVCFIHGSDDVVAPVEEGRALAGKNGAVFVELKGLGHCPFMNKEFNSVILSPKGEES